MADGLIRMVEEEFDAYTSGAQKNSDNLTSTNDGYKKKFQKLVNTGLAGNSVGKIGNQMTAINNSISNVNNIIRKHSNQMFNYDKSVAQKADEIDIPTDFTSNDSASVNYYTQTLVGKIDGRSVNEGHETEKANEIDETVINGEALSDIRGVTSTVETYDANSSVSGQSTLGNISGDVTQQQNYDASSSVGKAALQDISGDVTQQTTYDDSSIVGKTILGNVNINAVDVPQYDDHTRMITAAALKNIKQDEETKDVAFGDLQAAFASTVAKSEEDAERENDDEPNSGVQG